MKNKLTDLNNHLFAQLERLNDEDPNVDMDIEVKKAKAIASVANVVVGVAELALKGHMYISEGYIKQLPQAFGE